MNYLVSYLVIICIVLHVPFYVHASSQSRHKELDKSNYTVLGLTIGECSRHDILSKLGPTLRIIDEKNTNTDHLCYISDRDETLILFSFKANRCIRFQMMSRKYQFYKWHFCAVSPIVTERIATESGITLGMQKSHLIKILGTPKKESEAMLFFEFKKKKLKAKEELNKKFRYGEDRTKESSRIESIYFEARLVDSKLRLFTISL